jgi:hypothetical protein
MVLSTSGRAGVVSISGRVRAIEDLRARSYRASLAFCKCGRMQEWHNARPYAGAWWIIARVVDNTRDYRVRVRAASGLAFCKSLAECKAYPSRAWVRRVGASRARGARATCVRDVRVTRAWRGRIRARRACDVRGWARARHACDVRAWVRALHSPCHGVPAAARAPNIIRDRGGVMRLKTDRG